MPKTLVLAEKPSVGKEIARVLGCRQGGSGCLEGGNYIVTWALGHLVTLADPEAYDGKYARWRLEDLPMCPAQMKLVVIKQTGKQFSTVSALLRRGDVGDVVIATDAGREGELVARWILLKAGCGKPIRRLWISSQTDKAIREGFARLRPGKEYDNLFRAAQARAEADWLVGLNVTRALTCKHNAQLSAGRVQTPTLALIVAREEEIARFQPKEYYTLRADFAGFHAVYQDKDKQARFFDRAQAEELLKSVRGKPATVAEARKEYRQQPPPAAYDLTELQRDANKKYGLSAKQTLAAMQSLYEHHKLVTYPRTDSRYIPDDVAPTLPERLRAISIGAYKEIAMGLLRQKINTRHIVNNAKVTDHHAIIPTEEQANFARLGADESRIYDLVARRFLAVLSAPHEYDEVRARLQIGPHSFHAKGKTVRSPGWKAVYSNTIDDDDEDGDSDIRGQSLPALVQGARLDPANLLVVTGKTRPPARYTEATLLTAMENPPDLPKKPAADYLVPPALGTPATRADIIEKLFDTFYVERRGKELVPTSKGKQLARIVPQELRSAALTASWEQQLGGIATCSESTSGKLRAERFTGDMRGYAARLVSEVVASSQGYVHDNLAHEKCPECGKQLLDVNGKKGRMYICPDRDCGYRKSVSVATNARCPECHKKLELRGDGEKKSFYCVCGYRERLSDFESRRESAGANRRETEQFMQSQKKEGRSTLGDLFAALQENDGP
ncbi:MAG: DNA topoisomerase III [Oscillospiraceae bacterium]|jgi:DNA topoisomerase-3|nr:DNA topoisomerase III [Oscillospiraceae bacterium]